jgi:hypothetical protein
VEHQVMLQCSLKIHDLWLKNNMYQLANILFEETLFIMLFEKNMIYV